MMIELPGRGPVFRKEFPKTRSLEGLDCENCNKKRAKSKLKKGANRDI